MISVIVYDLSLSYNVCFCYGLSVREVPIIARKTVKKEKMKVIELCG